MNIKHYIGKPCKRGHTGRRYKRNGMCVECEIMRVRRSQELRTATEHNQYHREYNAHNIEQLRKLLSRFNETTFSLRNPKKQQVITATPRWVNVEELRSVYYDCLNSSDGLHFHFVVDHIIPISNPKVCGLHVPLNLQVVSTSLNKLKGNKFNAYVAERDLMKWLRDNGKTSAKANEDELALRQQQLQPL
ncbi:MAG: hypothetical protein DRQ39_08635 [Gammaproteobacteria bacterium]|nr:MAG: hypothetical protein DRQ39_08635 [Gammaproteobacteria bacterium]